MAKTKKQSIPIGPLNITERPPEPKYKETTPQDIADILRLHAKAINKAIRRYTNRRNDPEVAALYHHYRQMITRLTGDLPPELPGENFYAGLTRLAEYCEHEAQGKRLPLTEKALLIYEKLKSLPEHKGMTRPEILNWLADECDVFMDESTFNRKRLELLPYGLLNKKRRGYYFQ